jgi:hypothetical protein
MLRKTLAQCEFSRRARTPSRRRFLQVVAGTAGALGAGLLLPTPVLAAGRDPKPIPFSQANPVGGPPLRFNFPGPADAPPGAGNDPSTITDFDGFIGGAAVQGTGTGINTDTGETTQLLFDVDARFMQGLYQSVDSRILQARFVFV